jgi:hypothetical protein
VSGFNSAGMAAPQLELDPKLAPIAPDAKTP